MKKTPIKLFEYKGKRYSAVGLSQQPRTLPEILTRFRVYQPSQIQAWIEEGRMVPVDHLPLRYRPATRDEMNSWIKVNINAEKS